MTKNGGVHLDNTLFQEAKQRISSLMNMTGSNDHEAVQSVIESIYQDASPEQKEQLKELEQQLQDSNHLS